MSVKNNIFYAYLAGVFDGEGSIGLTLNKSRSGKMGRKVYILHVCLGMTNFEIPTLFKNEFGGTSFIKDKQLYWRKANRKPLMMWAISSKKAEYMIKCLLPYLRIKKKQAELGLKFREEVVTFKHKNKSDIMKVEKFHQDFKKLNMRGLL